MEHREVSEPSRRILELLLITDKALKRAASRRSRLKILRTITSFWTFIGYGSNLRHRGVNVAFGLSNGCGVIGMRTWCWTPYICPVSIDVSDFVVDNGCGTLASLGADPWDRDRRLFPLKIPRTQDLGLCVSMHDQRLKSTSIVDGVDIITTILRWRKVMRPEPCFALSWRPANRFQRESDISPDLDRYFLPGGESVLPLKDPFFLFSRQLHEPTLSPWPGLSSPSDENVHVHRLGAKRSRPCCDHKTHTQVRYQDQQECEYDARDYPKYLHHGRSPSTASSG